MRTDALPAALDALEPLVRSEMPKGRAQRRLPPQIADALKAAGLFGLWIPERYGGLELSLPAALRIYAAAARLDGALGWSVMIGAGGGLFAAYLEASVARTLFGAPGAVVAGSGAPTGTAERVPGGYRASGHWRYASGAHYATLFTANCRITEGGRPVGDPQSPLIRAMCFAPSDVRIHESWDTLGLQATGSHDMQVQDVFVPEAHSFSVIADAPREPGPLYRLPFDTLTELPVCAVALGAAERALQAFDALARLKPAPGHAGALGEHPLVRHALQDAHRQVISAREQLFVLAEALWQAAQATAAIAPAQLSRASSTCRQLVSDLVCVLDRCAMLAGMNAIHREDPFSAAWTDLHAVAAHYSVSALTGPPDSSGE